MRGPHPEQSIPGVNSEAGTDRCSTVSLIPSRHDDLAQRFLDHLRAELGEPGLEYAEPLVAISGGYGGYDTQVFSFRLNSIREAWAQPLIL